MWEFVACIAAKKGWGHEECSGEAGLYEAPARAVFRPLLLVPVRRNGPAIMCLKAGCALTPP